MLRFIVDVCLFRHRSDEDLFNNNKKNSISFHIDCVYIRDVLMEYLFDFRFYIRGKKMRTTYYVLQS